ncbi:MAG: hypothetical protein ACJAQT_003987 [Akkermansiaceae bacterium]
MWDRGVGRLDHEAAIDGGVGCPGFEGDVFEEVERDGPEGFWDDLKGGVWWEVGRDFVEVEPFAAAAVWGNEFWRGGGGSVDVVEETAVDKVLGDDGLVSVFFGEVVFEKGGELELMAAEAGELLQVVVAGVGAGEGEAGWGIDGEVELGGEFEVDELVGGEVAKEEIEFADRGVDVFLNLEALFEEIEVGGGFEEEGEGVFVEVAEFLLKVEGRD